MMRRSVPDIDLGAYQAFLFDMDGPLLTSRAAIDRVALALSCAIG